LLLVVDQVVVEWVVVVVEEDIDPLSTANQLGEEDLSNQL
jgi:hypothetical protein